MNFLKSALQDSDGTLNPAYLIAFILVIASVSWVSFLVFHKGYLPELSGIAYLLGGSGAMNIAHKAEGIMDSFRKNTSSSTASFTSTSSAGPSIGGQ